MSDVNNTPQFPSEQELTKFFGVEPERTQSCLDYGGIGLHEDIDVGSCGFSLDYSSGLCSISHSDAMSWMPDCETHIASRVWIDWEANAVFIEWADREPGSRPAAVTLRPPRIYRGSPLQTVVPPPGLLARLFQLFWLAVGAAFVVIGPALMIVAAAAIGMIIAFVILGTIQGCSHLFFGR